MKTDRLPRQALDTHHCEIEGGKRGAYFTTQVSESSLNAAMASVVLKRWAEALNMIQRVPSSNKLPPTAVLKQAEESALTFATGQRDALQQNAWNGSWFSRAWVDEQEGWVGTTADGRLELEPQSWAMLGAESPFLL
eukprot:COSAG06_NODE_3850_length_4832_cov_3.273822_3_plen_137_part_00